VINLRRTVEDLLGILRTIRLRNNAKFNMKKKTHNKTKHLIWTIWKKIINEKYDEKEKQNKCLA